MRSSSGLEPGSRTLKTAGLLLALGGLAFVGARIWNQAGTISLGRVGALEALLLLLLAMVYGGGNLLLALGWRHLLRREGLGVSRWWAVRTYGISQVAKYLPGNIFHFAGRQAMGMAGGLPGWALVRSAFWDVAVVAAAGAFLGSVSWIWWSSDVPRVVQCSSSLVLLGGMVVLGRWLGSQVAWAFLHAILFLAISVALFVVVVGLISGPAVLTGSLTGRLAAGYLVGWLLGMLTPGAPAGIGVREVALLALLHGTLPESEILLAIVLSRIVTTAGDGILFLGLSMVREVDP